MINTEKLSWVLEEYKERFSGRWEEEKYKWEAVKHFQDHWNIEAKNFGDMFAEATEKTFNLLASGYAYPRTAIRTFAGTDDEAVRQMFRDLFDESRDLSERVETFQAAAEAVRVRTDGDAGEGRRHYQNTNAISTYLWLRYPDKYYIYQYEIARDVAVELGSGFKPKRDGSAASMVGSYALYDEICAFLHQDKELEEMLQGAVTDTCYPDRSLRTATADVCFYLSRFYLNERKARQEEEGWLPRDYTPGLTAEDWLDLLRDAEVFTLDSLKIVKRMKDYGGQATCRQLSVKYGGTSNFYNRGSSALAGRIAKKTGCPLAETETGKQKLWPVLYRGKYAESSEEGGFIWKLRGELSAALEQTDLSEIPLYADAAPAVWKISHGTEATGISDSDKKLFGKRHVAVVHSGTKAKALSKVTQGQLFMEEIRKGDYFYLCYGNSIRLLGQFTGEKPVLNPELKDGWYEREYRVLAESKDTSPYTGMKKWWTPNDNSTCIRVGDRDKPQFEELILQPYFGMSLEELFSIAGDDCWRPAAAEYTKQDFLNAVYMTEERYEVLKALLRNKRNVILQGAPGVGKTFTARRLAYSMMGEKDDSRIEMVQFHQNYSYEDFVMGYRPDGSGFRLTEGIFYRFCKTAENHPDKEYFFIIDEINRGNMSKIFGELLMLIEKDYRGTNITLAYSGMPFSVPENLYIIGMMNTADRSLAVIDYALRRRFSFFEMEPGFHSDGFRKYQQALADETFNTLIDEIRELNRDIAKDPSLGRGFRIGHSYFCERGAGECTADWMRSVVEFDILPMLSEYWFDDSRQLQKWEKNLRGVFDDER